MPQDTVSPRIAVVEDTGSHAALIANFGSGIISSKGEFTMTATISSLLDAARKLAEENHESEPGIRRTYWFPDPDGVEIRLIHVDENSLESRSPIHPFYFRASPQDGLDFRSAIALIRPEQDAHKESLDLPADWGNWEIAKGWSWN